MMAGACYNGLESRHMKSTSSAVIGDEEAVAAINERFYLAVEDGDLEAMERIWLHTDWVMCVHPGWELIRGWDGVRESWRRIFENASGMRISPTDLRIHLAGDVAWVSCTENLVIFLENSSAPVTAATTATNLFQRVDGEWWMVHHHASPTPNAGLIAASDAIQ